MDINPQFVGKMVSLGVVEALKEVLHTQAESYDMERAPSTIKALKRISIEDMGRVLRADVIPDLLMLMQMLDKFP
jgi:hypothetical protein